MTSSPDVHAFKNFAMSQSPPSYSPMRRRETQETQFSESSPESGMDEAAAAPRQVSPEAASPQAASPEEQSPQDESPQGESPQAEVPAPVDTAMHEDDEDVSEDGEMAPAGTLEVPGVSVLQNANPSSEEEEDAQMGGEANQSEVMERTAPAGGDGDESEMDEDEVPQEQQHQQMATEQQEEQDASEDEEQEQPQEQPQEPQQQEPDESDESPSRKMECDQEMAGALVPVQPESSPEQEIVQQESALVAVEPEAADAATSAPVITAPGPRSPSRETWGAIPEEAKKQWSVKGDFCQLEINGNMLKLPRAVYDRLFVYQRQGVAWLWNLYQKTFGGILADEMGLGKTVQIAAFLACLKFSNEGTRFLVVVPPTLLEQWRRELKSWASESGLAVHVMHGTQPERRAALRGMIARQGVMVTTFDLVRNCIDHLRSASSSKAAALLPKKRKKQTKRGCRDDDSPSEEEEALPAAGADDSDRPWDVVIVDEGHCMKNPSCLIGRALRKLESRSRFLLTGTPLQNKLGDLWALMDFAQPGLLGNHATFERNFSEQISKGSKRNASRFAVELKDHLARELRRLTTPHFLRRLKDEVLIDPTGERGDGPAPDELPLKTDVVLWLNLTNAQVELYNMYLSSETVRRATSGKNGMEALRAIASLKKLCNHPLLCLPKEEFNEWRLKTVPSSNGKAAVAAAASSSQPPAAAAAVDMLDGYDDEATQPAVECHDFLARLRSLLPGSAEGAALLSCKLRVLSVLLPQLHKRGHRCLIFSHSTRMLDLIQACVLRVLGLKFLRIDGTIEAKDRDLKLNKFQHPDSRYFCMCLSTQVGGVGLTITGADRVILCDPAWNPAMDAQAIDRVHRIGQKREVVVYRLIGSGAIEDKMFRLQVFKRGLAKTAMEQESQVRFFSSKDLKQLFDPPGQSTSTQSLMAEQLGTEALEHEDLLSTVAGDIGGTDDADALPFWQSSDVLGFSDYSRLFMYLEQAQKSEEEAETCAKEMSSKLLNEDYKKDQVVDGKWRANSSKVAPLVDQENANPQTQQVVPLADQ